MLFGLVGSEMCIRDRIKQIENLVNEFSDFARMPKPTLKNNDLIKILNDNINLLKEVNKSIEIEKNKLNEILYTKKHTLVGYFPE